MLSWVLRRSVRFLSNLLLGPTCLNPLEMNLCQKHVPSLLHRLCSLEAVPIVQRSLPDALAACRFNPHKLLPDNPAQLPRGKQAALLELLAASSEAAGPDSGVVPAGGNPQLLPLLREMLGGATEELRAKVRFGLHL